MRWCGATAQPQPTGIASLETESSSGAHGTARSPHTSEPLLRLLGVGKGQQDTHRLRVVFTEPSRGEQTGLFQQKESKGGAANHSQPSNPAAQTLHAECQPHGHACSWQRCSHATVAELGSRAGAQLAPGPLQRGCVTPALGEEHRPGQRGSERSKWNQCGQGRGQTAPEHTAG